MTRFLIVLFAFCGFQLHAHSAEDKLDLKAIEVTTKAAESLIGARAELASGGVLDTTRCLAYAYSVCMPSCLAKWGTSDPRFDHCLSACMCSSEACRRAAEPGSDGKTMCGDKRQAPVPSID